MLFFFKTEVDGVDNNEASGFFIIGSHSGDGRCDFFATPFKWEAGQTGLRQADSGFVLRFTRRGISSLESWGGFKRNVRTDAHIHVGGSTLLSIGIASCS